MSELSKTPDNLYSTTPQLDGEYIELTEHMRSVINQYFDMNIAPNGTLLNNLLVEVKQQQTDLIDKLIAEMPPKWETPERRTEPSNRQLGYNDAIDEMLAVLNKYRGEL